MNLPSSLLAVLPLPLLLALAPLATAETTTWVAT